MIFWIIALIAVVLYYAFFSEYSTRGTSFPKCSKCKQTVYNSRKYCSDCEWELIQMSSKFKALKIRRTEIGKEVNAFRRRNDLRKLGLVPNFGQILDIDSELKKVRKFNDLGVDFEKYVGEVLKLTRYTNVETTPKGPDDGVDIFCRDSKKNKVLVQCKNFKSGKIGNTDVLKLAGSMMNEGSSKGLFISTVGFTRQAQKLKIVEERRIELLDWKLFYHQFLISCISKTNSNTELQYSVACESPECSKNVIHKFNSDEAVCECGRPQMMHLSKNNHTEWSLTNFSLERLVKASGKSLDYWME